MLIDQIEKHKYKKWFTLVELIIVITILAILSVVGFISFQDYVANTKDSHRLSTLTTIQKGLDLFYVKTSTYPKPDGKNLSKWIIDGKIYILKGEIGENIANQIRINTLPLDPETQNKYIYATMGSTNDEYQIATILEKNIAYNPIIPQVYAKNYQARVDGRYKWFLKYQAAGCISYTNIPSLIWNNTGTVNLLSSWEDAPNYVINNWQNLPYHSSNQLWNIKSDEIISILRNNQSAKLINRCEDELKTISEKELSDNGLQEVLISFWIQDQESLKNKVLSDEIKINIPYSNIQQDNNEVVCDAWYDWPDCTPKSIEVTSVDYNNIVWNFSPTTLFFGTPITKTWLQYPILSWVKELTITLSLSSDWQTIEYSNANESISCNSWFSPVWSECKRNIVAYDGWKRWSDENYAKSCNEYRTPNGNYTYAWDVWDGIYFIKPDINPPFKVYCDMTRDGGWWTLVVRAISWSYNHRNTSAVGSFSALWQITAFKFSDSLINTIPKTIYRTNNDDFSVNVYFDTSDSFASTRQVNNKVKPTYSGTTWYGPYINTQHLWFNTVDNTSINYSWQVAWDGFAYTWIANPTNPACIRQWFAMKWATIWWNCAWNNNSGVNWYIFLK